MTDPTVPAVRPPEKPEGPGVLREDLPGGLVESAPPAAATEVDGAELPVLP